MEEGKGERKTNILSEWLWGSGALVVTHIQDVSSANYSRLPGMRTLKNMCPDKLLGGPGALVIKSIK